MTKSIDAVSVTSRVTDWLASSHHVEILHIFDRACNLTDEHRQVLSIVTPGIGNGPFNVVIESNREIFSQVNIESRVSSDPSVLRIGDFTIRTHKARLWDSRPDWTALHASRGAILRQVDRVLTIKPPISNLRSSNALAISLATANRPASVAAAKQLAGLGQGLTPSGDDYITGALYAAWILHPVDTAQHIALAIADATSPLTTALSGAWLRAAGNGEAGMPWHELFDALLSARRAAIELEVSNILSIGATSGADAMAGFMDTLNSYAELERKHVAPEHL